MKAERLQSENYIIIKDVEGLKTFVTKHLLFYKSMMKGGAHNPRNTGDLEDSKTGKEIYSLQELLGRISL